MRHSFLLLLIVVFWGTSLHAWTGKAPVTDETNTLLPAGTEILKDPGKVPPGNPAGAASKVNTASTAQQPGQVSGTVSDQSGEPLPGVSITVKGASGRGTSTGPNGEYTIQAKQDEVLVFSFLGYLQRELVVSGQDQLNVSLEPDIEGLEEVVVVGYGTTQKSDLTGSVVSLREKEFTQGVNNNALQLLNGKAAGVHISQASSAPGGGLSVRIRGAGSINGSNDVLIVVDGLPGATAESLNPGDIASIEVLKDASAAAIYGTRAANGVILITTKKGEKGKPKVSYNAYAGIQSVAQKIDVLSARDYMNVLNGLRADQGQDAYFTQEEINAAGSGTNWQDELFRPAVAHDHRLSFSGGGENSTYYIGLNYFNQGGIVEHSDLTKYNVRLNYQLSPSDKFKISLSMNTNRLLNNSILSSNGANESAGPINTAIQFDPTLSAGLDENGRYFLNPLVSLDNPLALINGISEEELISRTFGTFSADYEVLDGLTATVRLGADLTSRRFDSYNSRITKKGLASGGIAEVQSADNNRWLAEFLAQYEKTFNQVHHLTLLGGITFEEFNNRNVNSGGANFLSDVTGTDQLQSGDRSLFDVASGHSRNRLNSFLGRLNYSLQDKYLLTASIRADGTSRFATDNKYAFFPSLAFAWRLIQEPFLKGSGLFSDLKLRAGFGRLGNQGIDNFETIQTFHPSGAAVLGGAVLQGAAPARIPNPALRWETSEEINAGLDFGLWGGRLSGSIEYFIKNTKDQLFSKPVPATTGFATTRVNFGNVRNSGIDLALESVNTTGDFGWRTSLTFSALKNEVTKLPDFIPEVISGNIGTFIKDYAIVREGAAMRSFYGYEISGIFQQSDDIASSAQPTALPGHPIFSDQNGDKVINAEDRVILGDPFPDYTIGFNNSFSYKGFGLEILFIAVQGIETLDANTVESLYPINFDRNRIAAHYLDRWTPDNPGAAYPSGVNYSSYGGARAINSLTVTDASFIRLKTANLSYVIPLGPQKLLSAASVFLAGDNLVTITDFEGFDPDANASGTGVVKTTYNSYPLARTIRLGVNLTF